MMSLRMYEEKEEAEIKQQVMFFPTRFIFPLWARRKAVALRGALERLRISDVNVKRIKATFELSPGLMRPYLDVRLPVSLDASEYLPFVRREAPIDGVEVVEWMHYAYADNCTLSARCLEYNALGSQMVSGSSDPAYPGLVVEDIKYPGGQMGREVSARGYAVAETPIGRFNVRDLGKGYGIFRDLLSAGTISYTGSVQWAGSLVKWKELARTPITRSVGFFRDSRGNVLANFFEQLPTRPKLSVTVRQRFSSNKSQRIEIALRDPTDYTRVLGTRSVDVATGTSEVTYTLSSFPYVPPLLAQLSPEDNTSTSLEEYVVI